MTDCFRKGHFKTRGSVCGLSRLVMPSLLSWWRVSTARTGHLNNQDSIPVTHSVLCSNHQVQTGSAPYLLASLRQLFAQQYIDGSLKFVSAGTEVKPRGALPSFTPSSSCNCVYQQPNNYICVYRRLDKHWAVVSVTETVGAKQE